MNPVLLWHYGVFVLALTLPGMVTTRKTVGTYTPPCPKDHEFSECGTACPPTCQFRHPRPCILMCVEGCFCRDRLLDNNGTCVRPEECPEMTSPPSAATDVITAGTPSPHRPTCTNGKVFTLCITPCPVTCSNHINPPFCNFLICIPGCACPHGLVEHNSHCVDPGLCPSPSTASTTPVEVMPPVCTNGQVYMDCGSFCPNTCQNIDGPPICAAVCKSGCFCPSGLIDNFGSCVKNCPGSTVLPPETSVVPVTEPTTGCPIGMEYRSCGPLCRRTCSLLLDSCFSLRCTPGCFCPGGLMEHEGGCVTECPGSTEQPPTTAVVVPVTVAIPNCPTGMEYRSCGPLCRKTCFPVLNSCFSLRCTSGCFCPKGLTEHKRGCVTQCPDTNYATSTTTSPKTASLPVNTHYPRDPCDLVRCAPNLHCRRDLITGVPACVPDCHINNGGCHADQICTIMKYGCDTTSSSKPCHPAARISCIDAHPNPCAAMSCQSSSKCVVSNVTGEAKCVPDCKMDNGGCLDDEICEISTFGCKSNSRRPCDSYFYRNCKAAPYVPCGWEAYLACDSEWTYCLEQNKTKRATCVGSCLSYNGGCKGNSVCITAISEGRPRLQCLDYDDLPLDCPAGRTMEQCTSASCQETCDTHLKGGITVCTMECARTCVCPRGLVLFRDRCVDPRLCHTLMTYSPKIHPLPIVDSNTVLLSINSLGMSAQEFKKEQQQLFLHYIKSALADNGISRVVAQLHGMYYNDPHLMISVQLSGEDIYKEFSQSLADILNQNSHMLGINVQNVQPEKVVYIDTTDTPSEGQVVSRNAVIGTALFGAVMGLVFVMMVISAVVAYCVAHRRSNTKGHLRSSIVEPSVATNIEIPDNVDFADLGDTEKVKLIKESLVY